MDTSIGSSNLYIELIMTTYKAIHGKTIQHVSSDPDSAAYEGQVWFNTATSDYKTIQRVAGTWSTGGALNTARRNAGGLGTQSAAMVIGGYPAPKVIVEEYNGTSWTEVADINAQRYGGAGHGTNEAALLSGGVTTATVNSSEEFDGSSWTEGNNMPAVKANHMSAGTQTSALAGLGENATANIGTAFEYDGTNYSDGGTANTARSQCAGCGTQTAAIAFGGSVPAASNTSEEYNGTAWAEGNNLNTALKALVGGGFGTQDAAIRAGGSPGPAGDSVNTTELYDGTSWSNLPGTLGTACYNSVNAGTSSLGVLAAGGNTSGSAITTTQEWDFTSTLAAGAWASGGNLNTGRSQLYCGDGIQTAGMVSSGNGVIANTELYDGSSWTEVNDLNTARYTGQATDKGTTSASLNFGGNPAGGSPHTTDICESWDGTNWTEVGDLTESKRLGGGHGTQTAALATAGYVSGGTITTNVFSWNGTAWSEDGDINTGRYAGGSGGTQTAAIYSGGYEPTASGKTEIWNGSAWSESGDLNVARGDAAMMTTSTSLAIIGGGDPSQRRKTEQYDGSAWTAVADSSADKYASAGAGTGTLGFIAGGGASDYKATEEWTVAQNIKTITD